MNITHFDLLPLVYGVAIFFGLYSMWKKLLNQQFGKFTAEALVFWLVFTLHGHSMTGGFAATIASLLAGMFFFRRKT